MKGGSETGRPFLLWSVTFANLAFITTCSAGNLIFANRLRCCLTIWCQEPVFGEPFLESGLDRLEALLRVSGFFFLLLVRIEIL